MLVEAGLRPPTHGVYLTGKECLKLLMAKDLR